ncbi:trypsin-like peptidase domain-containing protein [Methanobrevibacter smithii]|uniref:trypsin-like peptidase domain-containing protein n=1 Tax=Methanobrevibacter smithii TaxID=2173 RepID=UPI00037369C1|nr:trypsin-like peptidase domain-containing protein [Methanobrevibacter smithii]
MVCGSGFFLKNNYIITNAHVVENMDNLKIELIHGKKYTSTIIGKNIDYDICILKIKPFKTVKLLKFNSKDLKIGNIVILQQKSKIDFLSHFKKKK